MSWEEINEVLEHIEDYYTEERITDIQNRREVKEDFIQKIVGSGLVSKLMQRLGPSRFIQKYLTPISSPNHTDS